jgi:hypothetical protein
MRLIFEGPISLTSYEEEEFTKFKRELNEKPYDLKLLQDKNVWTDTNLMRFLQASGWNYNNAVSNIAKHNEWRVDNLPIKLDDEI